MRIVETFVKYKSYRYHQDIIMVIFLDEIYFNITVKVLLLMFSAYRFVCNCLALAKSESASLILPMDR